MDTEAPSTEKQKRAGSRFRQILPQVLAMAAANCTIMNMGVTFFFSTIVIADLHNSQGKLSMDDTQASWFGGLPYMCQPIGSIASGFLVMWLGRKRSLMLICVPHLLSCVLMSTAPSIAVLLLTNVIIGVTVGLTEAPVNSYFGEICQPKLRSILASSAALFYQMGMFFELFLGSLMHWRTTAAVSAVMPVLTFFLISQIPESPIWLVAQGRKKDAETALCWLRGWVEPSAVQQELDELDSYHQNVTMKSIGRTNRRTRQNGDTTVTSEEANKVHEQMPPHNGTASSNGLLVAKQTNDNNVDKTEIAGDTRSVPKIDESDGEKSGLCVKAKLLLEPETFRPLVLVLVFFAFTGMGGMVSIRPFIVEVLHRFHSPIDPKKGSVLVAVAGVLGSIFLMAVVSCLGKRKLALTTTAACAASCLVLGVYAYLIIEPTKTTGDESSLFATWLPLTFFTMLSFGATIQGQLPWLLVAEAFPFRTRGIAGGLAAGSVYLMGFVASKTYLATEHSFQLYGAFWFYGAVNCICLVYLFFQLPETEGKSLQEIERLFAGNKRCSSSANKMI